MTDRTHRFALILLLTSTALSQTPANKPLTYDVVSIKPNHTDAPSGSVRNTEDGVQAQNMPLSLFVEAGFHHDQVLNAPAWLTSERYDVQFKVTPADVLAYKSAPYAETQSMIHAVLEDRLHLKDHIETRDLPIYNLVLAKTGTKLNPATPADTYANGLKTFDNAATVGRGLFLRAGPAPGERHFFGQGAYLSELVQQMSYMQDIGRLVVDKTGLATPYDFTLDWFVSTATDATGPSLFTALQEQLGLRLEPAKGPVEVLVIDHIERPSAN